MKNVKIFGSISGFISGTSEKITVSNVPIGFTATKISPGEDFIGKTCVSSFFVLEDNDIRFTLDGVVPTSTVGIILKKGQSLMLNNHDDIIRFRAIRITEDATFFVNFKFNN